MTAPGPDRPRPVNDAAFAQSPLVAGGSFMPGIIYMLTLLERGRTPHLADWIIVGLMTGVGALSAWLALRRTVREAEPQVTPTESPRNHAGEDLFTRDVLLLQEALNQLVEARVGKVLGATAAPETTPMEVARLDPPTTELPAATPAPLATDPGAVPDWTAQRQLEDDEARAAAIREQRRTRAPAVSYLPDPDASGRHHLRRDP